MKITFKNQEAFHAIHWHDKIYCSLFHDYGQQSVTMRLKNHQESGDILLTFQRVVALQMQNCCFWGPSKHIYDFWIDNEATYFHDLLNIQNEHAEKYEFSNLDQGINYISVCLQLISGDSICITCECIIIDECDLV